MNPFWKGWLDTCCFLLIVFGCILAGAANEKVDAPAMYLLQFTEPTVSALDEKQRFVIGTIGVVTLCWGVTLFYMVRAGHKYGPPLWQQTGKVIVLWFVLSSIISLDNGFVINTAVITIIFIALILPLLVTRKL